MKMKARLQVLQLLYLTPLGLVLPLSYSLSLSLSHGLYTVLEALALMSGESKQQENLLFCLPIQLTNQPTHQLADQVQMNTASLLRASTSGNFQS